MGVPTVVDAALLDAWTADVDDPLAELFDAHQAKLYRLARRLSGSHDAAHDLVQETFLRAARRRVALPADRNGELAWLMRTVINLSRDRQRRQAVRTRHAAASARATGSGHPERAYVAQLAVQVALEQLDARRRAIVVLHEIEGESVQWIAGMLGIAPVTVRWHLLRARRQLSKILS